MNVEENEGLPLIFGRPFLKTAHALVDVFKGKLTLRDGDKSVTFMNQRTTFPTNKAVGTINNFRLCQIIVPVKTVVPVDLQKSKCGVVKVSPISHRNSELSLEFPELQELHIGLLGDIDEADMVKEVDLLAALMANGYEPTTEEIKELKMEDESQCIVENQIGSTLIVEASDIKGKPTLRDGDKSVTFIKKRTNTPTVNTVESLNNFGLCQIALPTQTVVSVQAKTLKCGVIKVTPIVHQEPEKPRCGVVKVSPICHQKTKKPSIKFRNIFGKFCLPNYLQVDKGVSKRMKKKVACIGRMVGSYGLQGDGAYAPGVN